MVYSILFYISCWAQFLTVKSSKLICWNAEVTSWRETYKCIKYHFLFFFSCVACNMTTKFQIKNYSLRSYAVWPPHSLFRETKQAKWKRKKNILHKNLCVNWLFGSTCKCCTKFDFEILLSPVLQSSQIYVIYTGVKNDVCYHLSLCKAV